MMRQTAAKRPLEGVPEDLVRRTSRVPANAGRWRTAACPRTPAGSTEWRPAPSARSAAPPGR